MQSNQALALKRTLVHEGGNVDHPADPGGRTRQGVTQRTYNGYRARRGLPARSVFSMTDAERDAIYDTQYWDAIKGDQLPIGVDYVVFDGAVNSGPSQSIKWLQRALGTVKVDGELGQATLGAVLEHPDHDQLIAAIISRRLAFLQALSTWRVFGRGWRSRVDQVLAYGQAQASGSVGKPAVFVPNGNAKATIEAAPKLPGTGVSDTGAGIGGGLVTGLAWLRSQLEPYAEALPHLDTIVAVVAVAGVAAAAGGGIYSFWARRRGAALRDALDLPATGGV